MGISAPSPMTLTLSGKGGFFVSLNSQEAILRWIIASAAIRSVVLEAGEAIGAAAAGGGVARQGALSGKSLSPQRIVLSVCWTAWLMAAVTCGHLVVARQAGIDGSQSVLSGVCNMDPDRSRTIRRSGGIDSRAKVCIPQVGASGGAAPSGRSTPVTPPVPGSSLPPDPPALVSTGAPPLPPARLLMPLALQAPVPITQARNNVRARRIFPLHPHSAPAWASPPSKVPPGNSDNRPAAWRDPLALRCDSRAVRSRSV